MTKRFLLVAFLIAAPSVAQQASTASVRTSSYFSSSALDFAALVSPPPAADSAEGRADMAAVIEAQSGRSSADVAQARRDDKEEDIFVFATVLGPHFNAKELPLTAALSLHLRQASAVINPELKVHFQRERPFVASSAVHPVCERTATNSYPSGHSMVGTLEGLALTQMVPERAPEILTRLDAYVHNRIVCGVHFPSDVAASRTVAEALFGLIAASPVFQAELAAARAEVRKHLALP